MLRLVVAGADTHLASSVCASCPHGSAGCCASPPALDWSDLGRIAHHGGSEWLASEVRAGRLAPSLGGLTITRVRGVAREGGRRIAKCVYHAHTGCTIAPERRAATCNYYVCEAVFAEAGVLAARAREIHAETARAFVAWDASLAGRVADAWPDGPTYDAAFFVWLGDAFAETCAT